MMRTRNLRRPTSRAVLMLVVAALALGALASVAGAQESLVDGSKNFPGAIALSQAYGQALEAKDFDIEFKDNIGTTEVVYPSLENGDLDAYADYQGTLLIYLGGSRPATRPRRTRRCRRSSTAPGSWRASPLPRST